MRIAIVFVVAAAVGFVAGCWRLTWRWLHWRKPQHIQLTEKRHAELLDVERRQHEER